MGDSQGTRTTEEFIPHWNWSEDSMGHYLSVHLPGFKKEEVMVALAYPDYVTISGERKVKDDKSIYFGQALRLPENLHPKKIVQTFEDEVLRLTFPKRVEENNYENGKPSTEENAQEKLISDEDRRKHHGHGHAQVNEEQSKQNDDDDDDDVVTVRKDMSKKGSKLERAIDLLKNNIVLTIVLAFLLGMFVSRRFESNG